MGKEIFKTDDKVFVYGYGWGRVVHFKYDYCLINFQSIGEFIQIPKNLISFKEYSVNGICQERLIDYKDYIGKWGLFKDKKERDYRVGILTKYHKDSHCPFETDGICYEIFKPLTEEQVKILEL